MTDDDGDIRIERRGRLGLVTLDRQPALNALTHDMVLRMRAALDAFAVDPAVAVVAVTAAPGRAFCAGGDIRQVYEMGRAGDPSRNLFFRDEYRLNALIEGYPKPYVALVDGVCMGGGVGLSAHGPHRVATERLVFAMPEVAIGFFPDVGGTYLLSRMPSELGLYLGLTGTSIRLADAHLAGFVTEAVAPEAIPAIVDALAETGDVGAALSGRTVPVGPAPLAGRLTMIEKAFSGRAVGEILARLDVEAGEHAAFAAETAAAIRSRSPTSLALTLHALRRARRMSFAECMVMEYRLLCHILEGHDFYEGVRAAIVDKDRRPRWRPAELTELEIGDIEAHFRPPAGGDIVLD
jgi:enoyl-CoA hydratase